MNHGTIQVARSRWRRGLLTAAAVTGLVVIGSTTAQAKVSPPERQNTGHEHTEWPEPGPLHPNDDPCSVGGPVADASVGCEDDSGIDDPGSGPPPWGGPGERIAVGRDMDDEAAVEEAEDEATEICHGSWVMRDFDFSIRLGHPTVYTLTYECS